MLIGLQCEHVGVAWMHLLGYTCSVFPTMFVGFLKSRSRRQEGERYGAPPTGASGWSQM